MEIIKQNPFRILGLSLIASPREITRKIQELSTFAEFGKIVKYSTDFDFISPINRSLENIEEASRNIELAGNKLYHSLFWFWSDNSVDELVFDLLNDGDIHKAIILWNKAIDGNVTDKTYSNARNLSLLYLIVSLNNNQIDRKMFLNSIELTGKVLCHSSFNIYAEKIVGATKTTDTDKVQQFFIDQILRISTPFFGMNGGTETKRMLHSFKTFSKNSYQYTVDKLLAKRHKDIENTIESTTQQRKLNPKNAYQAALDLIDYTRDNLNFLKNILSNNHISIQLLSDKVAEEILQCSTDFFNATHAIVNDLSPHKKAKELTNKAIKIAIGAKLKSELQEDIILIDRLIHDREQSLKKELIDDYMQAILSLIESLPDPDTISERELSLLPSKAKTIITKCRPHLTNIKNRLGKDGVYIEICDLVVNTVLGVCVVFANKIGEYQEIVNVINSLIPLDKSPELRERLKENKSIIDENYKQEKEINKIKQYEDNISNRIKNLPDLDNLFSSDKFHNLPYIIEQFLNQCNQDLLAIKNNVGSTHGAYRGWTNTIAQIYVSLVISYVNETRNYARSIQLLELLNPLIFFLDKDLTSKITENIEIITQNLLSKSAANKSSKGCYIATMVYGNYDAPEVLLLRAYRDNFLAQNIAGRAFIKIYYYISPKFVNYFSGNEFVQNYVHKILEKLITRIKK